MAKDEVWDKTEVILQGGGGTLIILRNDTGSSSILGHGNYFTSTVDGVPPALNEIFLTKPQALDLARRIIEQVGERKVTR